MFVRLGYSDALEESGITVEQALTEKFWVNGMRQKMDISEMSTSHIQNCIRFLERGFFYKGQKKIPLCGNSLHRMRRM